MNLLFKKYYEAYGFFVLPAAVFLIVGSLGIFFVQPKVNEILIARDSMQQESTKLQDLNTKVGQLTAIDEDALRSKLVKINVALPSNKDVMGLVVALEKMASEASLSADAVQLSPGSLSSTKSAAKAGGVASLEFQATFSGPFEGIKTFFSKLENGSRILSVKSVGLASSARSEGVLDITMPMTAYYLSIPDSMGAAADELPQITGQDEATYQKVAGFQMYSITPSVGSTGKLDPFTRF